MGNVAVPRGNGKRKLSRDEIIRRRRVHMLNKLFSLRYGRGAEDWQFPNDDAGLPDLKILIHYLNPLAMPRNIKLRAPWADAESIIKEIEACPKGMERKRLESS